MEVAGDKSTPTVADLACYFQTESEWDAHVKEHWEACNLGLAYSDEFESVSHDFYKTIRRIYALKRRDVTAAIVEKVLAPDLALLKCRRLHRAYATVAQAHPVEVRSSRSLRLPGTDKKAKLSPDFPGLSSHEAFLLQVATEAGEKSSHFELLQHHAHRGFEDNFPAIWRNMSGNLTATATSHCVLAWKRWREFVKETPSQWAGTSFEKALFSPGKGILTFYIAVRSRGGVTAAAGATAMLWRTCTSLGLCFPLDENSITGWTHRLRSHTVKPKIPLEVAQLIHFDYHAKYSTNPFVLATCASVWFSFLGMARDAHIQRSFGVKECENAWIFYCIKGKDRSKPYHWVVPATTTAGPEGARKMMSVVRWAPEKGEEPWLLRQWWPNSCDPFSGKGWVNTPIRPTQMRKARQRLMRTYPLNAQVDLDCCSYAARRVGPSLLALLGVTGAIRNAFGNWSDSSVTRQEGTAMADTYVEHRLIASFVAKFLVAESIRTTIETSASTNFQWGHVAEIVTDTADIMSEAARISKDVVLPERQSDYSKLQMKIDLEASEFLDPRTKDSEPFAAPTEAALAQFPKPSPSAAWDALRANEPAPTGASLGTTEAPPTEAEDFPDDVSLASTTPSTDLEAEQAALKELNDVAQMLLVTGKTPHAFVHVADPADDGKSNVRRKNTL